MKTKRNPAASDRVYRNARNLAFPRLAGGEPPRRPKLRPARNLPV